MSTVSQEFICKCGKKKGFVSDGVITSACPICGRIYIGKYNRRKLQIIAKQIGRTG